MSSNKTSVGNNIKTLESNEELDNNSVNSVNTIVNNKFANDGSFLQVFKQMQKQLILNNNNNNSNKTDVNNSIETNDCINNEKSVELTTTSITDAINTTNSMTTTKTSSINTNKRRTKTLKVGLIKKQRNDSEEDSNDEKDGSHNAWNRYMKEVRKYKEKYGDDNDKNRPLVK